MTRLSWDSPPRRYETGVDRGVFYPSDGPGEAWNGLISVAEDPADSSSRDKYVDGIRVDQGYSPGNFAGSISAFTYPPSFFEDHLLREKSGIFGLSYRTQTGTGHKIHLVYNVLVAPSGLSYSYSEAEPLEWEFTTRPTNIPGHRPAAHLVVDTDYVYSWTVSALEDVLYGSESDAGRLPSPTEILEIFDANALLQVVDHGDGTATITGPEEAIVATSATTATVSWPSVKQIDAYTYSISSW